MATSNAPENPDWNRLAQEALDLWQDHITSYTTDPVGKADLARFMMPMSQMFAEWSTMMQTGSYGAGSSKTGSKNTTGGTTSASQSSQTSYATSTVGAEHMAELADRVAELEQQLAALEQQFAAAPDGDVTPGKRRSAGPRGNGKTSSGHH